MGLKVISTGKFPINPTKLKRKSKNSKTWKTSCNSDDSLLNDYYENVKFCYFWIQSILQL